MNYSQIIIGCLLLVNVVTFIIYGIDKYKAIKEKWRIPEATLLLMAVFGGSIGAWLGMRVFITRRCTRILYWCADNHHTANSACSMACLQLSYEIGTQVPFHKALAFVYKRYTRCFDLVE